MGEEGGLTENPSVVDQDMYRPERFHGGVHDGLSFGHAAWRCDRLSTGYEDTS